MSLETASFSLCLLLPCKLCQLMQCNGSKTSDLASLLMSLPPPPPPEIEGPNLGSARPGLIPTPCRASAGRPEVGLPRELLGHNPVNDLSDVDFACDGPTLLEHSMHALLGRPYWEAATLVETLVEHFASQECDQGHHSHNHQPRPTPISIASSLVQRTTLRRLYSDLWQALDDAVTLFTTAWPLPVVLPAGLKIHPSTQNVLQGLLASVPDFPPVKFDVYTDGSYNGRLSGWSFVIVASWPQGSALYGHARGLVHLPRDSLCIGAREHSAINGMPGSSRSLPLVLRNSGLTVCQTHGDSSLGVKTCSRELVAP